MYQPPHLREDRLDVQHALIRANSLGAMVTLGPDGARANYGGSPGDADHAEPYLYIGPWSMDGRDGEFWTEAFGASLSYAALLDGADAAAFLRQGKELLRP